MAVLQQSTDQAGVMAAKTEAVFESDSDFSFSRLIGRVVEIALRVGKFVVDGGGDEAVG